MGVKGVRGMTARTTTKTSGRAGDYLAIYASPTPIDTRDCARKKSLDGRPHTPCTCVRTLLPGCAHPQTEPLTPRRQRCMQDELPVVGEGVRVRCSNQRDVVPLRVAWTNYEL